MIDITNPEFYMPTLAAVLTVIAAYLTFKRK